MPNLLRLPPRAAFFRSSRIAITTLAAALLLATAAQAQKAQDRLRVALNESPHTTLNYDDQRPEIDTISPPLYDTLVCYNPRSKQVMPLLAKSWTQPDDKTYDFQIRDDVKFHNGTPLTADDVVYTLNWARDPANKLRFAPQENFLGWIANVEKTGPYGVRITAKTPTAVGLIRLAIYSVIVSKEAHEKLATKSDYGRTPLLGTGPYKLTSFDPVRGLEYARNDDYKHGNPCKPAASIGRITLLPMPETQTQIAQMMTGGLDVMRIATKDHADALAMNPQTKILAIRDFGIHVLSFDSMNRTGTNYTANIKVRQAIAMALNPEFIGRATMPGGDAIRRVEALCVPAQMSCAQTLKPPAYDVAKAKALLAEAGYPNGFDTEILAIPGDYSLGEGVAGELRKIGIRASVDKPNFGSFRQKQADNKMVMMVGWFPILGSFDATNTPNYFFETPSPRNYVGDMDLAKLAKEAASAIYEPKAREDAMRRVNDRNIEMLYVLPLVTTPDLFAHSKDVTAPDDPEHAQGNMLYDWRWN